jgi:hypothetical protein
VNKAFLIHSESEQRNDVCMKKYRIQLVGKFPNDSQMKKFIFLFPHFIRAYGPLKLLEAERVSVKLLK